MIRQYSDIGKLFKSNPIKRRLKLILYFQMVSFNPIVFDNGSYTSKIGFANQDSPSHTIPTSSDYESNQNNITNTYNNINNSNPIRRGLIINWDKMEELWARSFLLLDPIGECGKDESVLLTEGYMLAKSNRHKMAEIMFENFEVNSLYISYQGVLSLFAAAKTTGIVIDIGEGSSNITVAYDGHVIDSLTKRYDIGGQDIIKHFIDTLEIEHLFMTKYAYIPHYYEFMKESFYIAKNYTDELIISQEYNILEQTFKLPDGNTIQLNSERFQCSEILFTPKIANFFEFPGVHQSLLQTINSSPVDIRRDLYNSIILSGGTTMLPGFEDRLHNEMLTILPNQTLSVNITAHSDRYQSTWIGGSILASHSAFSKQLISRQEYEEVGPNRTEQEIDKLLYKTT